MNSEMTPGMIAAISIMFYTMCLLLFFNGIGMLYYFLTFRPMFKKKYNSIWKWSTDFGTDYYKQTGGGSNVIRSTRLFLGTPKDVIENDSTYFELIQEPSFRVMSILTAFLMLFGFLIVIEMISATLYLLLTK